MGRIARRTALALGLVVALAAPAGAAAPPPTVASAAVGKLGTVLVDGRGFTLYRFTPDKDGIPTCNGACATAWPPVLKGATLTLAKGLKGRLGTVARADKKLQVTYNGIPLYRFAGDSKKGQANGQASGRVWYVVKPGEARTASATTTTTVRPTSGPTTPTTSAPSSGGAGGGDGYVIPYY